ncbi:MAG: CapA family protein [Lachnospiraceae bacterium]
MGKSCSIAFTGDIGFDRYMDHRWEDEKLLDDSVLSFLRGADHVVANVEGAMFDGKDDGSRGIFFHCMNPNATCVLQSVQADIWNISNNHIMDVGMEGLIKTREIAASVGSRTIGAGVNEVEASEPVYLEEAGGIGLFGVAYMAECIPATATEPGVFRWDDLDLIKRRIDEVKSKCRWCIVVAHGGEEFADLPNPYTRDRYIKYLELGADVVVAHHPHVPENYETFPDGKAIFYSLGNFIFDTDYQRAHPYTDIGVLLKLHFTEKEMKFEALGTKIVRGVECVVADELPAIFEDVSAEEFELLSPLAAHAFIYEERKKMIYLEPDRFKNADEQMWNDYFYSTEPDGYDEGAHMDLAIVLPYSQKVHEGAYKQSKFNKVKEYIIADRLKDI